MEVVRRCKASKVSPQEGDDVISRIPEDVITNILDRLPLRDAVGTSILSTSWRFKWTFLTQLIFDKEFFNNLHGRKIHFDKTNISRLVFHLGGGVTKFVLDISFVINIDDKDIHDWVMFLSRIRGFKELILLNWPQTPVKLPTHLFLWPEVKHLKLSNCILSPPYFSGFPKLLSLELLDVRFQDHEYVELNGKCPLLETLAIINNKITAGVKWVEIAKLKNVKRLGLSLGLLDNVTMVRLSTVFQHLSLLPKLQELCLFLGKFQFLPEDVAQNPVSTTFPFLKTLLLFQMDFSSDPMLSCAFGILFGCKNLQTLRIRAIYKNDVPPPAIISREVDRSTMGQLQLQNVKLESIKGLDNEVCLIKYMLGCSPVLKSLVIVCNSSIASNDGNEKDMFARKVLKLHRASPAAKIIF